MLIYVSNIQFDQGESDFQRTVSFPAFLLPKLAEIDFGLTDVNNQLTLHPVFMNTICSASALPGTASVSDWG